MAEETEPETTETTGIPPRNHRHRRRNEAGRASDPPGRASDPPGKVPAKRTINYRPSGRLVTNGVHF